MRNLTPRTCPKVPVQDAVSFGPFRLAAGERLLMKDGIPVELGARTLDTLIALISRPNEVIGKNDLMALVWPDVTVEEGSLRFHIAGLRKALGDRKDGARYISTLPGRGYCFVAPVSRSVVGKVALARGAVSTLDATFLPARLARMVGREDGVAALSVQLAASRFVTIVGAGGVGKTTVAVAVAHELLEDFAGVVLFVDVGMLSAPDMVPASLASMLGISVQSEDPTPSLIAYLRDKHLLLVLDNCEHLIEACARLAVRIFLEAPEIHILATSREPLKVEGEHVHRLAPLVVPPPDATLTASNALSFPAIQLFLERAAASGAFVDLCDADAAIVGHICRKLDGVALAIELAAGRVEAFGLQQTAALLDERLARLWLGQRTAPPRQKCLQATLDWSYELLSETERIVLRRLAVFVGNFTLEAALAVVTSDAIDQFFVLGAIDSLVAKSMVAARSVRSVMRYRLLDTTRAYVLDASIDGTESATLSARHASHFRRWLDETGAEWPTLSDTAERASGLADLNNVRAALEWCFGASGDAGIGVALAAAAAPVFLATSLLTECHRWSERAIATLDDAACGGAEEMHLQAALGLSSMFTRDSSEAARSAMNRSLAIAEERGDALQQLQVLSMLHMFHHRVGDPRTALHHARRSSAVAATMADPAALALAHSLLGISLNLTGDLRAARLELEAGLRHANSRRTSTTYLGFDGHIMAGFVLARTLWSQGHPAQAVERMRRSVEEATGTDHPVTISIALVWAISIFLDIGDLRAAEEHVDRFISRAEIYSLRPYLAVGRGFKGELALRRDDPAGGVESLGSALKELDAARYHMVTTAFRISLARGLAALGQFGEGVALIDETIGLVEENGEFSHMPELLRTKGRILLAAPQPRADEAETCFHHSIEWSRRQGAPAWELRTATDLAALWASQGRPSDARTLLQPVLEQFVEGFDTADPREAARVLGGLVTATARHGRPVRLP